MSSLFLLADKLRWVLINSGLEIIATQDFETDLNFKRDLTGSLERISVMSSGGRAGIVKFES